MKKVNINKELFSSKVFKLLRKFFTKTNEKWFRSLDEKSRKIYGIGIIKKMQLCFTKVEEEVIIQRFKGLGEMNPEQLYETTMDPEKRKLKQITIQDAIRANSLCDILMGDDPSKRKKFIIDNYNIKKL